MIRFLYLPIVPVLVMLMLMLSCTDKTTESPSLVKVNDADITEADVREEFSMLPPQIQELFMEEGGMESLIDELIKKELLYQEAKKHGFAQKAEFKSRVEDFKKRLMIELLLEEEVEKKALVSDQEIEDFYENNKDNFTLDIPGKKKKKEIVEFERVRDLISQRLSAEKQREMFDAYIVSLKESYKVELDREAIRTAFSPPPVISNLPGIGNQPAP